MFKKYLFLTPCEYTIGNAAEFIYYGAMVAKMKGKKLVLIVRQPGLIRIILNKMIKVMNMIRVRKITNGEIFNVFSDNIVPADRPLTRILGVIIDYSMIALYICNQILRPLNYVRRRMFHREPLSFPYIPWVGHKEIFNPSKNRRFSWERVISYNWEKVLAEETPICLDEKKVRVAKEAQVEMGLPENCWFVALHVRERGFYQERAAEAEFRCGTINNYRKAIDLITRLGGWVVRMGDATMTPLPKIEHVIDYPHTKYKSDFMDLYLIKNCRLYIGMDSGIWDVAHMFQKHNLVVNSTGWYMCVPPKYGDLTIIKHYYSKSRKRFLCVKELLEEPAKAAIHLGDSQYDSGNSEDLLVENTPDEIKTVVAEWFNNKPITYKYSKLQALFVEKRRQQLKRWIAEGEHYRKYPDQAYRLAARYCYEGTAGNDFLEKNWEYGEYLEKLTHDFKRKLAL